MDEATTCDKLGTERLTNQKQLAVVVECDSNLEKSYTYEKSSMKDTEESIKDQLDGLDIEDLEKPDDGLTSVWGITTNFVNIMIGAGIFVLPLMLRRASLIPGLFILAIMGILSAFSCWLLSYLCDASGVEGNWARLWAYYYGEGYGWITDVISILFIYGCTVSYAVLLKTYIRDLSISIWGIETNANGVSNWVTVPVVFLILVGICMIDVEYLTTIASVGIVAITTTLFIIVIDYSYGAHTTKPIANGVNVLKFNLVDWLYAFNTAGFSYACQFCVPLQYTYLKNRTPRKFGVASFVSHGIVFLISAIVATVGYFKYGDQITGEYLLKFSLDRPTVPGTGSRICMFMTIYTAYPCFVAPLRISLISLIYQLTQYMDWHCQKWDPDEFDLKQRAVTVGILAFSCFPALANFDVDLVISLVVVIAGSWIILGLPGLMGIRETRNGSGRTKIYILSWILFIFAVLLSITGLYAWIHKHFLH